MVNWEVAGENWHGLQTNLSNAGRTYTKDGSD